MPRSSAAPHCFVERAAHYRCLNRRLRPKTSFFAAAAWINELLGLLSSTERLPIPAENLLRGLGSRLLVENNRLARSIDTGVFKMPPEVLDHTLIEREQYVAEEFLLTHGESDPDLQQACQGIDALLNNVWLRVAAPLLQGPLRAMGRLARRYPLTFANRAHREALGNSIVRGLGDGGSCQILHAR